VGGLVDNRGNSPGRKPDTWLDSCPEFSRSLCGTLRELLLRWAPDLTEAIKWGSLCYSGRKLVCALGAFQKHAGLTFFRGTELPDPAGLFNQGEGNTNIRTIRLTNLDGLDRAALRRLLHAAVELDARPDIPPLPPRQREPWPVPDFLAKALKTNRQAAAFFAALAPTYQREYLVWLSTARREETRVQRLAQTLAALAAGRKWAQRKGV
jgi:uncharacterized protein YdeI (YjbR/CyaY-like superfamily)